MDDIKVKGDMAMLDFVKKQPPARLIAVAFLIVILIGSLILSLPFSVKEGKELSYIDALYTSASAVCVTGLLTVDAYDTFTAVGQTVIALLIQIGGLGVAVIGAGIILAVGKKMDLKSRNLVSEAMNLDAGRGAVRFIKTAFLITAVIEITGALLSFFVFIRDYPLKRALGLSIFHSIASFNNAGFDLLGGSRSLTGYKDDVFLNIVTMLLIILGGIGFLVIREVINKKFSFRKLSMHSKTVITVSAALTLVGAILIFITEEISVLGAIFSSVSTRTAGFTTFSFGSFTEAGRLVVCALMIIGASPGSTGGGIKTTTFFVILKGIGASATGKSERAFRYSIPKDAFRKATMIALIAVALIFTSSFFICLIENDLALSDVLFEMSSAFATVGLSTGITPGLSVASKLISVVMMYIGRLGPMCVATLWYFSKGERVSYPEGNISVG